MEARAFPYKTSVVTKKQYDEHMALYKGYIDKANEVAAVLASDPRYAEANATYSHYRGLKRGQSYALDGVILHEQYFQNLGNEKGKPQGKAAAFLEKYFGGYDGWKDCFTACAKSARGWCVCAYEQRSEAGMNILLDSHDDGLIATAFPVIVLDMYEHAYFTDFGTDKAAYISRFIENIPWGVIEKRAAVVI